MTHSELVNAVWADHKADTTKVQVRASIDAVLEAIKQSLAEGNRVEIRNFGVFETRGRRSYTARNPKTGQSVEVKPKKVPFFKAGKFLRCDLNKN